MTFADLTELLREAEHALARCYDVIEWPADRGSIQLTTLKRIRAGLEIIEEGNTEENDE